MQIPAESFYLGPFAVYTSPTGMTDPVTGIPYLGGTLHEGDYVDATWEEISQWNVQFGANLYPGRYRLVHLSPNATYSNVAFGKAAMWGLPTSITQAIVAAGGSGYTITATGASTGTVSIASSTSGGTAAVANLTLSGGVITGAQVTYSGANFTSIPTFTLSSVLSSGSGGSVLALGAVNPNFVGALDSSAQAYALVRGTFIVSSITAAQVAAGAWVVVQEAGIAPLLPGTASSVAAGGVAYINSTPGITVTATTAGTTPQYSGLIGNTLDIANANVICRVALNTSIQQN